jgi:hypothetical protein
MQNRSRSASAAVQSAGHGAVLSGKQLEASCAPAPLTAPAALEPDAVELDAVELDAVEPDAIERVPDEPTLPLVACASAGPPRAMVPPQADARATRTNDGAFLRNLMAFLPPPRGLNGGKREVACTLIARTTQVPCHFHESVRRGISSGIRARHVPLCAASDMAAISVIVCASAELAHRVGNRAQVLHLVHEIQSRASPSGSEQPAPAWHVFAATPSGTWHSPIRPKSRKRRFKRGVRFLR